MKTKIHSYQRTLSVAGISIAALAGSAANAGGIAGLTVPAVLQAATAPGASAPWAGWVFLASQPYLSIFSYALVLGGLVLAFWHRLLVVDLSARLRADDESLRATLGTSPDAPLHRCQLESLIHPAARVLLTLKRDPGLRSRIPELFDIQVLELLMPLSNRSQGNQGRSVFFGFLGTLLGILCGSLAYDKSNTGLLLQNIGLALITTMIGGVAAEIEAATLRKLDWIHLQLQAGRPASIQQLAASPLPVAKADDDHQGSVEAAPAVTP